MMEVDQGAAPMQFGIGYREDEYSYDHRSMNPDSAHSHLVSHHR